MLLVDDDANYRRALASFLEASFDIRIVGETGNGAEAAALAGSLRPDAAVVDLAMPGGGGLDVAAGILEAAPGTAVVVVTGVEGSEDDRRRADELGVAAWLPKGDPLQVENALRSLAPR